MKEPIQQRLLADIYIYKIERSRDDDIFDVLAYLRVNDIKGALALFTLFDRIWKMMNCYGTYWCGGGDQYERHRNLLSGQFQIKK